MILIEPNMDKFHHRTKRIEYEITESGCWECVSHSKDSCGYPMIRRNDTFWRGHRYSYTLFKGDIPEGLVIRHTCDNPACINPDHLKPGTQKDNVHDMFERNRFRDAKGENNPNFKGFDLAAIDSDYQNGMKIVDIFIKHGISKTHFYRLIKEGKINKRK